MPMEEAWLLGLCLSADLKRIKLNAAKKLVFMEVEINVASLLKLSLIMKMRNGDGAEN